MKKYCYIALIVIAISAVAGCDIFGPLTNPDVVKLDTALGLLNEGRTINITSITGGKVEEPFLPDCSCQHLHAVDLGGIMIVLFEGEFGPFPDPNPGGCGYGCIGLLSESGGAFMPNE